MLLLHHNKKYQGKNRLIRPIRSLACCLSVFLIISGFPIPAFSGETSAAPSWGSGRIELIIFSDYFCTPCQKLEPELDKALGKILAAGGVKVVFADLPIYKLTPLYNRYFLYAANAGGDYQDILKARRVLFRLADRMAALKELHIETAFKTEGVAFRPFDPKPLQTTLNLLIGKYKIHSSPSCVIKYTEQDIRTYRGGEEIKTGLAALEAYQKRGFR